jgi:hypothetical protein
LYVLPHYHLAHP